MNKFILIGCTILFLFFSADLCAKHKTKKMADREIWCDVMYRMAAPVLSNISEGKLQKNMQLEVLRGMDVTGEFLIWNVSDV